MTCIPWQVYQHTERTFAKASVVRVTFRLYVNKGHIVQLINEIHILKEMFIRE